MHGPWSIGNESLTTSFEIVHWHNPCFCNAPIFYKIRISLVRITVRWAFTWSTKVCALKSATGIFTNKTTTILLEEVYIWKIHFQLYFKSNCFNILKKSIKLLQCLQAIFVLKTNSKAQPHFNYNTIVQLRHVGVNLKYKKIQLRWTVPSFFTSSVYNYVQSDRQDIKKLWNQSIRNINDINSCHDEWA